MSDSERDEIPMLLSRDDQPSTKNTSSRLRMFTSRSRSASISIPTESRESNHGGDFLSHTAPLQMGSGTPLVRDSVPLYGGSKVDIPIRVNQVVPAGINLAAPLANKFGSLNGRDQKNLSNDDNAGKTDRLLKSGQLGMCNNPYCTTCPAFYKIKPQVKRTKPSGLCDHKFHKVLYGDTRGWGKRFLSGLRQCSPGIMNPHAKLVQQWNQFFAVSCLFAIFVDPLFFFLLSVSQA